MRRFIYCLFAMFVATLSVNAQITRTEDLEKYSKEKYGANWEEAATNLGSTLSLDKNNAVTFVEVIPAEGKTKEQLYVILNYWFTSSFCDANSVIKLNDKDLGTIIGQGYLETVAEHMGGVSWYKIDVRPVIKCDIKDGKVRLTYTIPFYSANVAYGGGFLGNPQNARWREENWVLDECFPFAQKDKHKKTSCKALVMAYAHSNVIMDLIEEAVRNGISGNETEDW